MNENYLYQDGLTVYTKKPDQRVLYNTLYEILNNQSKKIRKQEFKAFKKALKAYLK